MFKAIQNLYKQRKITTLGVAKAVKKGIITVEQYKMIVGEDYV